MTIKFLPNDKGNPPGKLADVELHFNDGPLDGLKLIGFAVWQGRTGGRSLTFPARQYSVNGERRTFALLRPITETAAQDRIRDLVLEAWAEHEGRRGVTAKFLRMTDDVPPAVRLQAQGMADADQVPHYIVREETSWLVTPEKQDGAPVVQPLPPQRPFGVRL